MTQTSTVAIVLFSVAVAISAAAATNEVVAEIQIGDSTYRNAYVLSSSNTNVVLKFDGGGKSFKPWELPEPFRAKLFTEDELDQLKAEWEVTPKPKMTRTPLPAPRKFDMSKYLEANAEYLRRQISGIEAQIAKARNDFGVVRQEAVVHVDRAERVIERAVDSASVGGDPNGHFGFANQDLNIAAYRSRQAQALKLRVEALEAQKAVFEAQLANVQQKQKVEAQKLKDTAARF